jgi:hypothetical protein
MPICKHCSKDTEEPKTTACFNSYMEYPDILHCQENLILKMKLKDVLSAMWSLVLFIIMIVIWRNAPDAGRGLYHADV